jgi:TrmH family RNA methyltransferase
MSYRDRPDGLLAIAPQVTRQLADLKLPANPLLLVCVSIEKPGNLGTMLRTADATGVDAVLVCDPTTDVHNPNVVRASVGTLFTVPVVECGSAEARAWLQERGIQTLATTPDTEDIYFNVDMRPPTALILGCEQLGLDREWLAQAGHKIRIPMLGQADSLNVSAACTLVLYEAVRQRKYSG